MVNIAIVGCGRIATLNVLGYIEHPDANVIAVCDVDGDKARAFGKQINAQKVYTDYAQLLADPDIHAVELLVPHHLHKDMTVAACRAGKHVSVQKPMALNLQECDEMIAAARENGVLLKVYENFIFYPPYRKAKELIDAGAIGEPVTIRLRMLAGNNRCGWYVDPTTWLWRMQTETCGGGPLVFDDGNHKFSVARFFMGEPEEVFAFIGQTPIPGAIYDAPDGRRIQFYEDAPAMITWRCKEGGRQGVFDISYAPELDINTTYYACDERVEITGTHGVILITRCTGKMIQEPTLQVYRDGVTTSYHMLKDDWADSFIACSRDFIDAIVQGRAPALTGEGGRAVIKFSLAAMASAEQNRPVMVDTLDDYQGGA
jgi:predicted dehydrogenase